MQPKPFDVPQAWWEWWASVWDTDRFTLEPQTYFCTILAGAGLSGQGGTIQVPEPFFVFGVESCAFITANGGVTTWPYRIGFKVANGNDWFSGQVLSQIVTGDEPRSLVAKFPKPGFEWPKTLNQNDTVSVTVDNNVNAAAGAITVDATLRGYAPRELREAIVRAA